MTSIRPSRREVLAVCASGMLRTGSLTSALQAAGPSEDSGTLVGEPTAEEAGQRILAEGGNIADAMVAAALASAVAAPSMTGFGGYGMTAIVAMDGGRRIMAIDGNSSAPEAMTRDFFKPDSNGQVPNQLNEYGWLSAGVPGVPAGLELLLKTCGTRRLDELLQPAIRLADEGIMWTEALAASVSAPHFRNDPGSRSLYFPADTALAPGQVFKNPELGDLLRSLAAVNSFEPFYRGDIAQRIADSFRSNNGLVTVEDLARHQARMVEPLSLQLNGATILTPPLTSGGISVLQMLTTLREMNWPALPEGPERTLARIEASRLAWRDRLTLLGDPDHAAVPAARLLSADYARESAERIRHAVRNRTVLAHRILRRTHTGTVHLSGADRDGNFAALTLTHGGAFGSRVTVDGLGLTLGHGISRFDPRGDHPNSPGPGKRPLHNMVPCLVLRDGKPVMATGAVGGRKIPNAVFEVLTQFLLENQSFARSIEAPRFHTEGDTVVSIEASWPGTEVEALREFGYQVATAASARVSAVCRTTDGLIPARR